MRIEVLLFDGFDELDALGPFEVLANAATVREDLEVRLAAASGPGRVTGSHGVRIAADATLGEDPALVVVPGGGWETPEAPGVGREIAGGSRLKNVRRAYPRSVRMGRGVYAIRRSSRVVYGIRRGRVRFVAIVDRGLAKNRRMLVRYVRRARL